MIEADRIDGVGQAIGASAATFRALQVEREARFARKALQLGLKLRQRMPVATHEQQHRKLITETRHATFADIAAAVGDHLSEIVDNSGAIRADRGYGEKLVHASAKV